MLSFFVVILIAAGTAGCSWFGETTEPKNEAYESGKKALSEGKYEEAKAYFRNIDQSSPFYPQAVWMIQKVPFKKAWRLLNKKNISLPTWICPKYLCTHLIT